MLIVVTEPCGCKKPWEIWDGVHDTPGCPIYEAKCDMGRAIKKIVAAFRKALQKGGKR
jgi:hypothetical protein